MDFVYLATFLVAFISSILSGAAGGGGSFIMAPYWLIAGLSPAQGATTGAFMALGLGGGSLAAFRGSKHTLHNKKLLYSMLVITAATSLIGPFFLNQISTEAFRPILVILTFAALPLLFIPRERIKLGKHPHTFGWFITVILLLASSFINNSAFSILLTVVLLQVFRLSVLQSIVIRRIIGMVQSLMIFIVLFLLGNFLWQHAVAGLIGGALGSYLGTKFAIRKGERFAKIALTVMAVASSIVLLI